MIQNEPVPSSEDWPGDDTLAGIRRIPVWAFIVIAAVYLVLIQGVQ